MCWISTGRRRRRNLLICAAFEELLALRAIDDQGELTKPDGARLALAPCGPRTARFLLASLEAGCSEEALDVACVLATKRTLRRTDRRVKEEQKRLFRDEIVDLDGDHATYVKALRAFRESPHPEQFCSERAMDSGTLRGQRSGRSPTWSAGCRRWRRRTASCWRPAARTGTACEGVMCGVLRAGGALWKRRDVPHFTGRPGDWPAPALGARGVRERSGVRRLLCDFLCGRRRRVSRRVASRCVPKNVLIAEAGEYAASFSAGGSPAVFATLFSCQGRRAFEPRRPPPCRVGLNG